MKFEFDIGNRALVVFLLVCFAFFGLLAASAYNVNYNNLPPANATAQVPLGHSADEVIVKMDDGSLKSVQELLKTPRVEQPGGGGGSDEFSNLKLSHIIRPIGSVCPEGYEKMEIGANSGDDEFGIDSRRYWDCATGKAYYDGCAINYGEKGLTSKQNSYNVLCLAKNNKMHYVITSINSKSYSTCPSGWTKYDSPKIRMGDGRTYFSFWDCQSSITSKAGCSAFDSGNLATSSNSKPPPETVRLGRLCISGSSSAVTYLVVARNAVCPAGWTKTVAANDGYWDCSTGLSAQGGCVEAKTTVGADRTFTYGTLCS